MRYGITPYVGFSYDPNPLQALSSCHCSADMPARLDVWQKIVKTIAAHLKAVDPASGGRSLE